MNDLWDIKIFRKNLMIISVINILVFIFAWNIKEINIFWLIKLEWVESFNILILLILSNFYIFIRYIQKLIKNDININYKLLFIDIINLKKEIIQNVKVLYWNENITKTEINNKWDILINWAETTFKNILNNKNISSSTINNKDTITIELDQKIEWYANNWISLICKKGISYKITYLIFIIKDNYFFDYYLPIIIWTISISLILIKIFII